MQATVLFDEEALPLVASSLEMKRRALEFGVVSYRERLGALERESGMTTDEFVARFQAGDLGDDARYFSWEYLVDAMAGLERQLEVLSRIHL